MKRYTIFILLAVCFHTGATAQQKISFKATKQPIEKVLREIEQQSHYTFSYSAALLKDFPPVTVTVESTSLETVLDAVFGKSRVQYIIRDKHIILKERPKNITISGIIHDAVSRETLIAANVFDYLSQKGAVSNNFGFYSLTLPPGRVQLRGSYVGYGTQEINVSAESDTTIHFFLQPSALLQEVVIEGKQTVPFYTTEVGKITLNAQTLQALPSFLGEKDVIKSLQLMPGVAAGTEGVAGMYVRGGNLDENLYLVDGNPLYHVNHLGGIFSTFNPEAVKTMDFYKGSFPARYGGRLSSVVDVRMNDGSMRDFSGTASIGLISSRFNLQGPIVKDKTSFNVSLRRTYLDLILRPALHFEMKKAKKENPDNYDNTDAGYYFYDFNAKINHKFSDKSRLYLSVYDGKDKLFLNVDSKNERSYNLQGTYNPENPLFNTHHEISENKNNFDMGWGTRMASLNWAYAINSKLFSNATLVYSRYASDIITKSQEKMRITISEENSDKTTKKNTKTNNEANYRSGIQDIGYRLEFDYTPVSNHYIRFGTSLLHHQFRPEQSGVISMAEDDVEKRGDSVTFANERVLVKELSLYAEDEIDINRQLKVNAGLHLSGFLVQGKTYLSVQPRVSARYLLTGDWSLKASYGKMNQYVHLLQSSYLNLPNDLWVPITKNIQPMVSHQVSAGVFGRWRGFDLSAEGYYKSSKNQVEYKDGANIFMSNLNWEQRVAQGLSKSYGMELMANKTFGNTSGWLGYT
ncbi:MAG: TonB-dependent receptor, partial [Bacteroidia bacterium]|nr:TonB-dependent receptor [Bacteroidia bacterium]